MPFSAVSCSQAFQGPRCVFAPRASCACLLLGGDFKASVAPRDAAQALLVKVPADDPLTVPRKLRRAPFLLRHPSCPALHLALSARKRRGRLARR